MLVTVGGRTALAFEAHGDPEPVAVGLDDAALLVHLAPGGAAGRLRVPLDAHGLPRAPLRFRRGAPMP